MIIIKKNIADLNEKTNRYKVMLENALMDIKIIFPEDSYLYKISLDIKIMSNSYYNDGIYFMNNKDNVNALASFSYAYGWLDAGVRMGLFFVTKNNLFSI